LLNSYGVFGFHTFLKNTRISTLVRSADDYGLPLIIGGAEVTVWDMVRLFRGLANDGAFEPLQVTEENLKTGTSAPLISRGACYLTLEILKDLNRPGAEYYWKQYKNQWPLAWKTGTSYGHRDAWAVGVSPQWTIAIWIGNFDGEGNKNLSGAASAGPLLFEIFNNLPHDPQLVWFGKPEADLSTYELCSETGFIAGDNCLKRTAVEGPQYMKPLRLCPYHESFWFDKNNKYTVCSRCWEEGYHKTCKLIYTADIYQYMFDKGYLLETIPRHNPKCPVNKENKDLQILYPYPDAVLWIPKDFDLKHQEVVFRAAERDPNRKVFWYLNDKLIGETKGRHILPAQIPSGWHEIYVIDDAGNKDNKKFSVKKRE
jgi:penicillin-binding protein 1C